MCLEFRRRSDDVSAVPGTNGLVDRSDQTLLGKTGGERTRLASIRPRLLGPLSCVPGMGRLQGRQGPLGPTGVLYTVEEWYLLILLSPGLLDVDFGKLNGAPFQSHVAWKHSTL